MSLPEDALTRPLRSSGHDESLIRSLQSPANEDIHGNGMMRSVRSIHENSSLQSLRSSPGNSWPIRSAHHDAIMRSDHHDAIMRSDHHDAIMRSLRSVHGDALSYF